MNLKLITPSKQSYIKGKSPYEDPLSTISPNVVQAKRVKLPTKIILQYFYKILI